MQDLPKNTYPYGLNILIVAILIVFSFLVPGLNVGAFISFLIIAYTRKIKLTGKIVLVFCLYVILLSFLIKQNIFHHQADSLIKWLAIAQEPFCIGVFLLIFSTFSTKKLFSYGHILGLIVLFSLFQEVLIRFIVLVVEKKSIDYIHFSIPPKSYALLMQGVSERMQQASEVSQNALTQKEAAATLKQSMYLFSTYWGAFCAVLNGCFFMVLARFLGRKYVLKRFSLRQILLPKWILSTFLTAWLLFLLNMLFDFSSFVSEKHFGADFLQPMMFFVQKTSTSFLIALTPLFFFQGVAVLIHFFRKMMDNFFEFSQKNLKILKHFHSVLPFLFLLALLFFLKDNKIALLFVILTTECLGIVEMWFNFRQIS